MGDDGVVIDNISMSDVRQLAGVVARGDVDAILDASALTFLRHNGEPRIAITASPADTLISLMELMCVSHVHRVHVVNSKRRPIGVVTAMDVVRLLLSSEIVVHALDSTASADEVAAAGKGSGDDVDPFVCPGVMEAFRGLSGEQQLCDSHLIAT